jgi:hypothetical protein
LPNKIGDANLETEENRQTEHLASELEKYRTGKSGKIQACSTITHIAQQEHYNGRDYRKKG